MSEWGYYCAGLFVGMMFLGKYRPRIMREISHFARWFGKRYGGE